MKKSLFIKSITIIFIIICYILFVLPLIVKAQENIPKGMTVNNEMRVMTSQSEMTRVISMAPSITEMVFALEKGHVLVGRSLYSTSPKKALDLPVIGSYYRPDLEKILSLKPDLCIAIKDGTPKETINRLRSLDIEVLVLNPDTLETLKDSLLELGSALNAEDKSQELLVQMNIELEKAQLRIKNIENLTSPDNLTAPTVILQLQKSPLIIAGNQSFLGGLIEKAGGNTIQSDKLYPSLSLEEVLTLNPDIILIIGMGEDDANKDAINDWNKWDKVSAVKNNRVYIIDEDLFTRPSLRTPEALHTLIDIFYGVIEQ